LGGHLSGSLEKACNQTKKALEKIKGKGLGTQPHKRPHISGWLKKFSNELGHLNIEVGNQLAVLCAEANKMSVRKVQQSVFLILNRVPVTFVTDPEFIRASIPVLTHSLDQTVMARKAKARRCTAEIVGNI
jgi:hypothetical protein